MSSDPLDMVEENGHFHRKDFVKQQNPFWLREENSEEVYGFCHTRNLPANF